MKTLHAMANGSGTFYNYTIVRISEDGDTAYQAVIPKFPKIYIFADTAEELPALVSETIADELAYCKKKKFPIPAPDITHFNFSGKILLRMNPELHQRLSLLAQADEKTLNGYISNILTEYVGERKILAKSGK